jgi:hypothetical protein
LLIHNYTTVLANVKVVATFPLAGRIPAGAVVRGREADEMYGLLLQRPHLLDRVAAEDGVAHAFRQFLSVMLATRLASRSKRLRCLSLQKMAAIVTCSAASARIS